jgi:hypothetical protein
MRRITLIALSIIFVSILITSCEKDVTPQKTVEYSYNLGVITPDIAFSPRITQEASTSYTLDYLDYYFTEFDAIKGKISSISYEYDNIYSIRKKNLGYDDIDLSILCDYETYQQNENSFLLKIIDTDNVTHEITFKFKLFTDETFKLVRALINNSRDNSLKLTGETGDTFTGVSLFNYEMDDAQFNKGDLTFKLYVNERGGRIVGRTWLDTYDTENYDHIYLTISTVDAVSESFQIWNYFSQNGGNYPGTIGMKISNLQVNGNTVSGSFGVNNVSITLN